MKRRKYEKEIESISSSVIPTDVEVTKYIKTEILYDTLTKKILETKETELTEEQYNMLDYISEPLANCSDGAACWETEYKKVSLRIESPVNVLTAEKVILTTTWKKVPSVKSYDIIAVRLFFLLLCKNIGKINILSIVLFFLQKKIFHIGFKYNYFSLFANLLTTKS